VVVNKPENTKTYMQVYRIRVMIRVALAYRENSR